MNYSSESKFDRMFEATLFWGVSACAGSMIAMTIQALIVFNS